MIRIAITGPESSGKTALAQLVGQTFPEAMVVPEYAREFLEARLPITDYSEDDLLHIGKVQHQNISLAKAPIVVCDTDYLVLHVWMSEVFEKEESIFYNWFVEEKFDLVFLCAPDIDWQPDPLRENETDRWRLFERYETALQLAGKEYDVVSGRDESRVQPVLELIRSHINR
jgi:nicotinamide riboside kinase